MLGVSPLQPKHYTLITKYRREQPISRTGVLPISLSELAGDIHGRLRYSYRRNNVPEVSKIELSVLTWTCSPNRSHYTIIEGGERKTVAHVAGS